MTIPSDILDPLEWVLRLTPQERQDLATELAQILLDSDRDRAEAGVQTVLERWQQVTEARSGGYRPDVVSTGLLTEAELRVEPELQRFLRRNLELGDPTWDHLVRVGLRRLRIAIASQDRVPVPYTQGRIDEIVIQLKILASYYAAAAGFDKAWAKAGA